jgi:hypothetical protein
MMTGISKTLHLKKLKGGLLKTYLFFRNPYAAGELESGIKQLERFHPLILRKDAVKPVFSVLPCECKPMLADQDCRSIDSADNQLLRSIMAARSDIRELLVFENSKIFPEETECP